jgi:HlyD family secretion protein
MTQNVVTYTVEIVTDNSSLKLLPYLTANVRFVADHRDKVLTVPNTALRWWPANIAHPEATASPRGSSSDTNAKQGSSGTVWILGDQGPIPVTVRVGLSDGTITEISGEIHEGDSVIVGDAPAGGQAGAARSPFTPQLGGRRR